MAAGPDPEQLFDHDFVVQTPLGELWRDGEWVKVISPESEEPAAEETSVRLHVPTGLLLREIDAEDPNNSYTCNISDASIGDVHFAQLRRFGMCVVSHTFQPETVVEREGNDFYFYGASLYVPDSRAISDLPKIITTSKFEYFVAKPLLRYLKWAEQTAQPYVLSDIYSRDQYSKQLSSDVVFLHDIDPYLELVDEDTLRVNREDIALTTELLIEDSN